MKKKLVLNPLYAHWKSYSDRIPKKPAIEAFSLNPEISFSNKCLEANARWKSLNNELKKKHLVRVNRLAIDMKVTEMTIRRDLKELEDYGHLTRIHGGAKLKPKKLLPRR